MILQHYKMVSFQKKIEIPTQRKKFTQLATQKSSHRCVTRCETDNKVLQTDSRAAIYQETSWSRDFIKHLDTNFSEKEKEKVKDLEEKVTGIITDYERGGSTLDMLELIDTIERLGLGYRFQNNITRLLKRIAKIYEYNLGLEEEDDDGLYEASLKFRLLRQHGFTVSQDFLRKFKDSGGGLLGCLQTDVKALLSIYEASYLALEGEIDLHEAKLFATKQLLKLNGHENEVMALVYHALDIPSYRTIPRLQARWYIDAYAKRKDVNQLLVEFAVLDFNMVQSLHKKDLQEVSKWWEHICLASKLSLIRNRVVECFFVSVAVVFEPQYYSCREGLTKVCALIATIDDIYDIYGSLNELEVFTNAVKRWDIKALKYMPENLQLGFLALYNTINEMGYNTLITQGENSIPVLAKVWGEICESFFEEAKWNQKNYMPTFDDYLNNALQSVGVVVLLTHGYFLMNQGNIKDAVESLKKYHDLFIWPSMISRLSNDLAISTENEIATGKSVNAISCYMHEHDVSEEVARENIKTLIEKAWMNMIEARLACSKEFGDPFIDMVINIARFSHCTYQYGDGMGAPDARAKDRLSSVIIEPVTTTEKENN